MKAEELRLGNLVSYKGDNYNVWSINNNSAPNNAKYFICLDSKTLDKHLKGIDFSEIEPIHLTEKKLLELGFEKNEPVNPETHSWADYTKDNFTISMPYFEFVYDYGDGIVELKSIHHLQNLYHALTGEELEVK